MESQHCLVVTNSLGMLCSLNVVLFIWFQFEVAVITKDGVVIEPATTAHTNWEIAPMVK